MNTEVAGTVVRPGPGAVTDVRSSMAYNGAETWDRYIDGVDVAAQRIQIVAVDVERRADRRIGPRVPRHGLATRHLQ